MLTGRIPKGLLRRLVAGATFSALSVQLLYSLNPQIEVGFLELLVVTCGYAIAGGLLIGFALWGLRLARKKLFPPGEARPHGFGFIVFASAYCGGIFWMHRLTHEIYLPVDAVTQLSRSAGFVGILTICLFVLWLLERNAIGWRKQVAFGIATSLIAMCLVALSLKRATLDPRPVSDSPAISRVAPLDTPLVVVAVRYLPYDWIVRLEGEADVPYFTRAAKRGFRTRIEPFPTTSRRAIWASLLTGKLPYQHGVTGVYAYRAPWEEEPFRIIPNGLGFRSWGLIPTQRTSMGSPFGRSRPFWSVMESVGVAVLHSAEAEEGSPRMSTSEIEAARQRLASRGEEGKFALGELDADLKIFGAIRESRAMVRVAEADGLRAIHERLGSGNDLQEEGTARGEIYRDCVYLIGEALAELRARAPDATFVVVSPSAFRPNYAPDDLASYVESRIRAETGESDGFLIAEGRGIRGGAVGSSPAGVTDLVPSLFFGSGWPVARDFDGRVIAEMFREDFLLANPLELVPTWDVHERE